MVNDIYRRCFGVVGESPHEVKEWRLEIQSKGLRINKSKTETVVCDFGESNRDVYVVRYYVMEMGDDFVYEK